MKAIIDSNVFIGAWYKRDQYKEESTKIIDSFVEGKIKKVFITTYVLLEVINFLMKKVPFEEVKEYLDALTMCDRIKIINIDTFMLKEMKELFEKYKTLSLTDCSLIITARQLGIKEIYSFDSGFDKVKEIKRKPN